VAIARIQMPAAFDCRNEPFPPPFIETFPEINVVASVAIGWQRLNIIKPQNAKVSVCPHWARTHRRSKKLRGKLSARKHR
jgi:hypothetical protein